MSSKEKNDDSLNEEIQQAKETYNKKIPQKIEKFKSLIEMIIKKPEKTLLEDLKFILHKTIGSLGVYGYKNAGILCQTMEKQIIEWLDKNETLTEKHFSILQKFMDDLKKELKYQENENNEKKQKNGKKEIFILEDDEDILKIIKAILEKKGYIIFEAKSIKEATILFQKREGRLPDLTILDRLLPDGDGLEFYKHLKRTYPKIPPTLIISKLSSEKDVLEGLQEGVIDYITKPFSIDVLITKVGKLLKKNEL